MEKRSPKFNQTAKADLHETMYNVYFQIYHRIFYIPNDSTICTITRDCALLLYKMVSNNNMIFKLRSSLHSSEQKKNGLRKYAHLKCTIFLFGENNLKLILVPPEHCIDQSTSRNIMHNITCILYTTFLRII